MLRFFAEHPTAANLLMILLLAVGILSLPGLKRQTFPDFSTDAVEARIAYPGADAQTIEEALCQRLEDAVDGIENVKESRCEARESIAVSVIEMREGGDYTRFIDDIKTEIDAIDDFPENIEIPIIKPIGRTDPVVSIAVAGPMSVVDLKAYAEQTKERLKQSTGVSLIDIQGFSEHQIRIEIEPLLLRQYGLSVADIANTINRQSIDLPAGALQGKNGEILLRFNDERHSLREFEDLLIIGSDSGAQIRLSDIAHIEDRFELDEEKIIFNGQRAALLNISKTRSEDSLDVFYEVKDFVEQTQASAPPGVTLTLTNDVSSLVEDRLLLLLDNAWQGVILVALTLWLFFNIRFSFWVVMGLPVSFLGSICLMNLLGYSLNMLSMVGLLIAIGLLMDDAIVIAENIASHVQKGKSALRAAIDGTAEVSHGVIAAFITTACVFTPLMFMEGDIGKVLRVMPVVLIMTLAVSLIEAFWLLPRHMVHALETPEHDSHFRQRFEAWFDWLRDDVVCVWAERIIQWRYLFIGAVFGLLFASIGMLAGGVLKFSAFPALDGDILEARILLPQGTPLKRTETVVKQVTDALEQTNQSFTPKQPEQQRECSLIHAKDVERMAIQHRRGLLTMEVRLKITKSPTTVVEVQLELLLPV
ncbi:MAG: efflux RND transporter permease subunit, partial [Pseudomonadota bacterium]